MCRLRFGRLLSSPRCAVAPARELRKYCARECLSESVPSRAPIALRLLANRLRFPGLRHIWINDGDREIICAQRRRTFQSPKAARLAIAIVADRGTQEFRSYGLRALMRRVHLKNVVHRRSDETVFVREEQRIQAIDQLRAIRHCDFVRMPIKNIQSHRAEHRVPVPGRGSSRFR